MRVGVLVNAVRSDPHSGTTVEGLAPGDRAALGAAAQLAAQCSCEVIAIAAGPAVVDPLLRSTLHGGARRALRVWSSDVNRDDHWAVSRLLASALRHTGCEVAFAADRSANWGSGMMGPAVAHELKIPHISGACAVERRDGKLWVRRRYGERHGAATISLPALITFFADRAAAASSLGYSVALDADAQDVELLDLTERNPTGRAKLVARPLHEMTASAHQPLADAAALCARLAELRLLR